ncbi:hypothetical protein [Mucilaginibacter glaciei]|uniref:Outer membrane protein beta-barrel domain-containing protein n=1 Tax=Mucilaginibacter glaciei TaxID=2772109 RepID=A0A926NNI0_9SPHI|nr:hypothetical protein [Mucilaginibacter glaciei]MBD1391730.1 hypothetical protein [Mucilaginibacter glaciei]
MKTTKQILATALTAVAIFIGTSSVNAQSITKDAFRFGVGVEGLLPTGGQLKNISNIGLGGTGRLQYGLANNLALTLTSGYYNYFGKENTYTITNGTQVTRVTQKAIDFGMVPVKLGIKAFVGSGFYFSAEGGAGFETKDAYRGATGELNGKATKLILSPGIGYASQKWDVGARYENFSGQDNNYGTVGLRIAYGFGL